MDGSLHFFSGLCPRYYMFFSLSGRTKMICHGSTILHLPVPIDFCIPHDFAQSSISDMFTMTISDPVAGFAFVYMEDERDAEDAIRKLDSIEFGRKGRRIRVEWTKEERPDRRSSSSRRSPAKTRPSKTLFVINFDPINTRTSDLEKLFEPFGQISNVRIRRNFAFIQYESVEDAIRALEATNMSTFMDRVISVEYSNRDDGDRQNGNGPDRRGRNMSPDKGYDRRRSPSPYRRIRSSPDYGHGSLPMSRPGRRASPDYGRAVSPVNGRYHSRSPPPRGRY